jgi:hypothetical protein
MDFGPTLLKANVSGHFLQFRTLFGSPFLGEFLACFLRALKRGKFTVIFLPSGVPKSRTKLTRTLWYTLGTAHEFEKKRPRECRASIEIGAQMN